MQLLIVEDNPSTLKMLSFLLRNEGYKVHTAANGAAGLYILRNEGIDLLVLDVMLPDANGLHICRQLRGEGMTIPILVISALGHRDDKLAALNEGADDYITKPFDPSEVIARVHSLIRRTQPTMGPQLQTMLAVGSFCLDTSSQTLLTTSGRAIGLTKMEAQLLHVLMRNAGQVVSYDRLISEAWGTDYDGTSNQLEVYVHRLRNKLRTETGYVGMIKTIQGSGYELVGG